MRSYEKRIKDVFYQSGISGIMMIFTGAIFLGASIMILLSFILEGVFASIEGQQIANKPSISFFEVLFILPFALVGLGMITLGIVTIVKRARQNKLIRRLKEDGQQITAKAIGCAGSGIRVNNRPLLYLKCIYTDSYGKTYTFKSKCLLMDPTPFLSDGKVTVYCDRDDMNCYFVDVDGSLNFENLPIYNASNSKYDTPYWDDF